MKTPTPHTRINPQRLVSKYFLITALSCLMGSTLFAYTSTWTWIGPVDGLWNTAANWSITGSGSGAPTYNDLAVITNTQAIVTASDAYGGSVYVQAPTTGTITGVAPVVNFTGGINQFNNGWAVAGSGGNNYGGVINQTGGFLGGLYNAGTNNLNLAIASQGAGFTNAVGTFSFGGTSTTAYPYYLGGTNGSVAIGTNKGENGMLLFHDIGIFSTYGVVSNGTASIGNYGGTITVAGNGANGGIGTISATGHQVIIQTQNIVMGGVSATGGTATLMSTLDSTGVSYIFASNSIQLGTHAFFNLRVSGADFTPSLNKVYTPAAAWGALTGTFSALNSGSTYSIPEGSYLTAGGYKFKTSYKGSGMGYFTLTVAALPFSNPAKSGTCVTITQGGVYEGYCWTGGTSGSAAVTIATTSPVTFKNCLFTGQGDLITNSGGQGVWGANLVVKNCTAYGYNTNLPNGSTKGCFMNIAGAGSLDVENCLVQGCTHGVHVNQNTGAGPITIKYNQFKNLDGRYSNGSGGYQTTNVPGGHAVQIMFCFNLSGAEIGWNEIINTPWAGAQDDDINLYDASGISASPLLIHDNYIYGAWTTNPSTQTTGAMGICMDGSAVTAGTATGFAKIYNNQVVTTGNGGLGLAAGHDDIFSNNRVISSGKLPDGSWLFTANVGIAGYNAYGVPGAAFFNNTITNNLVGWIGYVTGSGYVRNDAWCPDITYTNVVTWPAGGPTLQDEADEYLLWVQKLQTNGISVGPQALPSAN